MGQYSPTAYIDRAKGYAARLKQETKTEQPQTAVEPISELQGLVKRLSQGSMTQSVDNIKPAPYLAKDVRGDGLAYYGTGFQGFMRKMWADLSDPMKYRQDINLLESEQKDSVLAAYENRVEQWAGAIEEKTKWSDWGEKLFGLTSEELAVLPASMSTEKQIAEEAGKNLVGTVAARMVRLGVDTVQNALWGGLEILALGDKTMRKIHSTAQGLDAVADEFNRDEPKNIMEKIFQNNPFAIAKDVYTVTQAVNQGKITWSGVGDAIQDYQKGSEMVYSIILDEMARVEFERGLAEGKDPGFLAHDLGRPGIELLGSIAGDPLTYLGLSLMKPVNVFSKAGRAGGVPIKYFGRQLTAFGTDLVYPLKTVGKIPTFGEVLGLNIGRTKRVEAAKRFFGNSIEGLENVIKKADTFEGEREASRTLARAVEETMTEVDSWRKHKKWWEIGTVDSEGKIRRVSKDADYFLRNSVSENGLNETMLMLRDMMIIRSGGDEAVKAAARLLPKKDIAFSSVGRMVGEVLYRINSDNIFRELEKVQSHADAWGNLYKKLENAISDFVPSVDEMLDAERKLKLGEKTPRFMELAEMAKDVPRVVRMVNKLTRPAEKISRTVTKGMVTMFMDLIPRPWARNVYGQAMLLAVTTDLKTAINTSIQALGVAPAKGATDNLLKRIDSDITKLLGFTPIEATLGVGDALDSKGIAFLKWMQRSEQITASNIVVKTVRDELTKAIPAVIKNLPEWDDLMRILPVEQQSVITNALRRTYGNLDEAVDVLRRISGDGKIEAWRVIEPPEHMRKMLVNTNLIDEFYDIQKSAKTPDEFMNLVDDFVRKYDDAVTKAGDNLPHTNTSVPEAMRESVADIADNVSGKDKDILSDLIQSWENTLTEMHSVVEDTLENARRMTNQNPQLAQLVETTTRKVNSINAERKIQFDTVEALRNGIVKYRDALPDADKAGLLRMWNEPIHYRGAQFTLKNIYPNVNLADLDSQKFRRYMWTAFSETTSDIYRTGNGNIFEKTLAELEAMAKGIGAKMDDIATADKSTSNPFETLFRMKQSATNIEDMYSWKRFLRQFDFMDELPVKPDGTPVMLKDVVGDFKEIFPTWKGGQRHIVNAVNKDLKKTLTYDEITLEQAYKAIWNRSRTPPDDGTINEVRILLETKEGFLNDIERWKNKVVDEWNVTVPTTKIDMTEQLRKLKPAFEARMAPVKTLAGRVGVETRNFILHDYDKTYFDHGLSYLFGNSFHYWTTRTYVKSVESLIDQPKLATAYLAHKEFMTKSHSDMPDWYKQNIQINGLPGIDTGSTYFINIESMINPIYGLTGVDFNDPRKRVDWVSRMVDDMGKLGPNFSPVISWAVALNLYNQGETQAAERWFGRLLPQSQAVKSVSGALGQPIEIDPFVKLFGEGGVDPYERNRVIAALAIMVQNGEITQEQMIEVARVKEGELWERAVQISAEKRHTGDIASFFFGAGARPRTEDDMKIEKFWGDYSALLSSRSLMTPDQYRDAWNSLRENPEYGAFVDGLLLSRKSGADHETAYAYNVLSRIPPGQMNDVAELVGITPSLIRNFYDAKGDLSKMTPSDQKRFMAGIEDMGLMLAMPDNATRREWTEARKLYSDMKEAIVDKYGEDVYGQIESYYEISDSGLRQDYLDQNPLVRSALMEQDYLLLSVPQLNKYYGGITAAYRYFSAKMYRDLDAQFGDVRELEEQYYDLLETKDRNAFLRQNPVLKRYMDAKNQARKEIDKRLQTFGAYLPESPAIQQGASAQNETQQALLGATTPQVYPVEYWQNALGIEVVNHVADYFDGGKLSYYAQRELEYQARLMGMSLNELLNHMNNSLQQ